MTSDSDADDVTNTPVKRVASASKLAATASVAMETDAVTSETSLPDSGKEFMWLKAAFAKLRTWYRLLSVRAMKFTRWILYILYPKYCRVFHRIDLTWTSPLIQVGPPLRKVGTSKYIWKLVFPYLFKGTPFRYVAWPNGPPSYDIDFSAQYKEIIQEKFHSWTHWCRYWTSTR